MSRRVQHQTPLLRDGYGIVPRKLMRMEGLSAIAKAVYAYLASFAGDAAQAFPRQSLMCMELGLSDNTLRKYLVELEEAGAISTKLHEPQKKFSKRKCYQLMDLSNLRIDTSKSEGGIPSKSEGDINNNSLNINKQITATRKSEPENDEIKTARKIFTDTWLEKFAIYWSSRGQKETYTVTAEDRIIERKMKTLSTYPLKELIRRMGNWFSIPDSDRDYFPLQIHSFCRGIQKPRIIKPTAVTTQLSDEAARAAFLEDERRRREASNG